MEQIVRCMLVACACLAQQSVLAQGRRTLPSRAAVIEVQGDTPAVDLDQLRVDLQQVAAVAARELMKNIPPEETAKSIVISFAPARSGAEVLVQFYAAGSPKVAELPSAVGEQLLGRVIEQVPGLVKSLGEKVQRERMDRAREIVARCDRDCADAQAQIAGLRDQLRKLTGRIEVSPSALRQAIAAGEADRQRLSVEREAIEARRLALEKAVATAGKRAEESAAGDAVLKELDLVRAARSKELEDLNRLRQTGAASSQDVLRAQAAEADARVRMLERRNEVIRQAGGAALLDLNRELLGASVAGGELDARIKSTSASLAKLAESTSLIEQLEIQQRRLERLEHGADLARERLLDAELRSLFTDRPRVYVE